MDPSTFDYGALPKEQAPCPLCDGAAFEELARTDRYGMGIRTARCLGCGFVMTNPRPAREAMEEFYRVHYHGLYRKTDAPTPEYLEQNGVRRRAAYTAAYLKGRGLLPRGARILDLGCADGSILRAVRERASGLQTVGIEPGPGFARFAAEHAACVVYPSLDAVRRAGEPAFDLIVVNHVLEHVHHPVRLLGDLKALLRPGGAIYADVPDLTRYASRDDLHIAHLQHFSPQTLLGAARAARLAAVAIGRHDPPRHPPSIRSLMRLQGREAVLPSADRDDGAAWDRLRAIGLGTAPPRRRTRRIVRRLERGVRRVERLWWWTSGLIHSLRRGAG